MKGKATPMIYLDPSVYDIRSLTENLTRTSDCFQANSEWLRFGAHAKFLGLDYLPIEAFKHLANELHIHEKVAKTFYSSGTTIGDRSKVEFSKKGLELYEQQAWMSFQWVLKQTLKSSKLKGYSLIPLGESWADSSLAHMLKSFQKKIPLAEFSELELGHEPVWIFGTAFHFVNLFDENKSFPLPKGSIIFETGGTKGKSRELDRKELYECICELFSIPSHQIVSEYGMSELSCQAYDFVYPEKNTNIMERRFRFPSWVETRVIDQNGDLQLQGRGALCVYDPLRVDLGLPIRTQDLVDLSAHGDFQILGRIKQASLKGCSMRVEKPPSIQPAANYQKTYKRKILDEAKVRTNSESAIKIINGMLNDKQLTDLLLEFFSNKQLFAEWMLEDLKAKYPTNSENLAKSVIEAKQHINYPGEFYLIGASSHPFAILPILVYAYILEVKIKLKPSKKGASLERYFSNAFSKSAKQIQLLGSDWRLEENTQLEAPIIVFGSDETIAQIKHMSGTDVQGFGSQIRLGICYSSELKILKDDILKEAFTLEQKGCRCIRMLIEIEDQSTPTIDLSEDWKEKVEIIDFDDKISLQHYYVASQLSKKATDLTPKFSSGYFPSTAFEAKQPEVNKYLATSAFVLPIIKIKPNQLEKIDLKFITGIACSPKSLNTIQRLFGHQVEVETYGTAHQKIWTNYLDGQLIFHMTAAGAD